jgi:hypothetical protein
MDPTPDPNLAIEAIITQAIAIIFVALAVFGVGVLIMRAGRLSHPGPLIVSLSLLTAIALLGGIIRDSPEVLTLAATGLGALAGSLSAVYQSERAKKQDNGKPRTEEPDKEE